MTIVIHTGGALPGAGGYLGSVKGIETDPTAAPVDPPSDGDRWIVGTGAVDVWAGHDTEIAEWEASTTSWVFTTPTEGDFVVNEDDPDAFYIYDATSSNWVKNDPRAHASTHQDGGDDEIDVTGLSGELADNQNPTVHGSTHSAGQPDTLDVGDLDSVTAGGQGEVPMAVGDGTIGWAIPFAFNNAVYGPKGMALTGPGTWDLFPAMTVALTTPPNGAGNVFALVTMDVKCTGGAGGQVAFRFTIDGTPLAGVQIDQELTAAPGTSESVTISGTLSGLGAGIHTVQVEAEGPIGISVTSFHSHLYAMSLP